jgi:hypothetical protein
MNPIKYRQEIETEQWKYSDKCIYHLSKSHTTDECNVKKECENLLAGKKNAVSASTPQSSNSTAGHLHNLKEDIFEDAVAEDIVELLPERPSLIIITKARAWIFPGISNIIMVGNRVRPNNGWSSSYSGRYHSYVPAVRSAERLIEVVSSIEHLSHIRNATNVPSVKFGQWWLLLSILVLYKREGIRCDTTIIAEYQRIVANLCVA